MKNIIQSAVISGIALFSTSLSAQIQVTNANLPHAGNMVWLSRASGAGIADPALTGTNYTWDYSTLQYQNQKLDSFLSVSATTFAYQLYFNNIFLYPENKSTVALAGPDIGVPGGQVTITDVDNFFRLNSSEYVQTGFGATINSIPTSVRYDPNKDMDMLYKLPLNYGNGPDSSFSSYNISVSNIYFGSKRHRKNVIDGWGTVITPFGSFNSLRIKSTSLVEDSINYNGLGSNLPARNEVEYKWVTQNHAEPVLSILKTNGNTTSVQYLDAQKFAGVQSVSDNKTFSIYPTLVSSELKINFSSPDKYLLQIYSVEGKLIREIKTTDIFLTINVNDLASGVYTLKVNNTLGFAGTEKFVKE